MGATLAAETADVHERLDAGDPIAANAEAQELRALAEEAIAGGDVPRRLARELRGGVTRLVALTEAAIPPPSAEPAPPPPPEAPDEEGKDESKEPKEPKEKGRDGDEEGGGGGGDGGDGDD